MEEELDQRFKIVCKELKLCGIPLTDKLSLTYKIFYLITKTSAHLTLMTTLMHCVKNRGDVNVASGSLREGFSMISILWLQIFASLERKRIAEMLILSKEFIWEELPTRSPETGSLTNAGMISRAQTSSIYVMGVILGLYYGSMVLKGLTGTTYPLLYSTWVPLDLNDFRVYLAVNMIQIVGSIHFIFAFIGVLVLYISFASVICCQLEKAEMMLKEMKYEENDGDSALRDKFREFVILHQKVIRFMKELQEVVGMTFFGPFMVIVAILCFSLFGLVKQTGNTVDTIMAIDIIGAMLSLLFAICAVGTKLALQTEKLRDAVWECEWVGTPVSFQKSLTIVLTATKEFTLLAGKIIPLSRNTALQVLNNTYTFLMILLNSTENYSEN